MSINNRIQKMNNPLYPLSSKYDPHWIIDNQMGSHCLWLTEAPEYLKPCWHSDFNSYHSPLWWNSLWEKVKSIQINNIDSFENKEGFNIWREFLWILDPNECKWLDIDNGRNMAFLRMLATKIKST